MQDVMAFAESRVGTTLRGKYRLEALLGVGGMAAVYRATHRVGTRVALKVLHPHMSVNADVRARFLREGYVANRVEHPGAVRVLDDDTAEDGSVFLAMELLEGEPLDGRWSKAGERLPAREVAELGHQLLDVLAAAHERGIVHRDIKPENLFLTRDGVLKVLDFGIARLVDSNAAQSATRTGRMLGSPAYMGPEQALGLQREIDGQTDVWSAGATMFTLLSGQFVHDAETVEAMLVYAGSRPARTLRSVAPEVPELLAEVVDRALLTDKKLRWGSARAMQASLAAAYGASFGARMPGTSSVPPAAGGQDIGRNTPVLPTLDGTRDEGPVAPLMLAQTSDDTGTEIMSARSAAALRAPSTTAGIARDPQEEPIPAPPRTGGGRVVVAAAAALLVLAGAATYIVEVPARNDSVGAAAPSPSGVPAIVSAAPPASSQSAAPVTTLSPEPSPKAPPSPPLVRPLPSTPGLPPPAKPPATASTAPAAPAPSICKPVPYFDDQGNEHFRQECH